MTNAEIERVLTFWFADDSKPKWFESDAAFDGACHDILRPLHDRAIAGRLDHWQQSARGALALVILLDQAPRNLFRGQARAYASDAQARDVTKRAIGAGLDTALGKDERMFLYLPLEHSEDIVDQDSACALFAQLNDDEVLAYAERHRDIIVRFGRFPHRNAALGRASTPEELAFLSQPGSSF